MVTEKQIIDAAECLMNSRDYLMQAIATAHKDARYNRINYAVDNLMDAAKCLGYVLVEEDDGK